MDVRNHWIRRNLLRNLLLTSLPLICCASLLATDGHFLHGAGPVNEAMGGADTGLCLDATGSIEWNPACGTRFLGKRLEFHGTLFVPWRDLSSSVSAGAFGPNFPGATLQGTTVSHRNPSLLPGLAFIYHPQASRNAFHFAMLAVSGFGVDYDQSKNFSNPILTPQPPNGFGFGQIKSNYALLKVPLGMSRLITDKLSVGISVAPAYSLLKVIPAPFAAPVTAGSTMPYYLSASTNAGALGIGVEGGLQYEVNKVVSLGVAYHSPVWFQEFNWKTKDATGAGHTLKFQMNLPQFVTMGVGVSPAKGTRIGLDVRWFNYTNTAGFDEAGFDPDDSVAGFGWNNIWAMGGGVQQQITSRTKIIGGYNYSQNPIPVKYAFLNTPAPAIVQHHLSGGIVQKLNDQWDLNFTYYHAFRNALTGQWLSPQGPIPGTSVTSRLSENSFTVGASRSF